jgi:predicted adenylyl cyclase CyaB
MDQPKKMKALLTAALDVKVVVDKKREIYYINNVKFHIDEVKEIGNFVEIEAIDEDGSINEAKLHEQCEYYMQLFKIKEENLVAESYSDLVIE